VHDITAARLYALPALYRPRLTCPPSDPGYEGSGIHIPVRQPLTGGTGYQYRTRNAIQRSLRPLGERGSALLSGR
jgi:hypothetical protein